MNASNYAKPEEYLSKSRHNFVGKEAFLWAVLSSDPMTFL